MPPKAAEHNATQSPNSGLYVVCTLILLATMMIYTTPLMPMRPTIAATDAASCHGAHRTAARSNTAPKWTIVGVANAGPASAARGGDLSAMSVMTTNCNPVSAPADEPTMT